MGSRRNTRSAGEENPPPQIMNLKRPGRRGTGKKINLPRRETRICSSLPPFLRMKYSMINEIIISNLKYLSRSLLNILIILAKFG